MQVVQQRDDWDCGPAALASLAPWLTLEAITAVGAEVDPRWEGRHGFFNREMVEIAARLAITLEPKRAYDLDTEAGILRLYWHRRDARAKASPHGHFVAVLNGQILDPSNGSATAWRTYQARHAARFCTLLRRA